MWCLSVLFILFLIHTAGSNKIISITPSPCFKNESCLTLSMLVVNISNYLSANMTLIFQEGLHNLNSELSMSNIGSLRLSINDSVTNANIICSENASLKFTNISQLWISRLTFFSCSSNLEFIQQFNLEDSTYQDGGRGLFAIWSNVIITNSIFKHTTADIGGAILVRLGSNVTINNCTFADNSATGFSNDNCSGGALFIDSNCSVEIKNSNFINNTSEYSGGAIALVQAVYVGAHNVYSYNGASNSGGAIFGCNNSNIIEDSSFFSDNIARKDGGTVFASGGSSITVKNGSFTNNMASDHGGVLFATCDSKINMSNGHFNQNEAGKYKEILHAIINGSIPVHNRWSYFENLTDSSGGGVMYASHSSTIIIDKSSFSNNTGSFNGGVLHANTYSNITVTCSYFSNNTAGNDGGMAFILMNSNMTVWNTTFHKNLAISGGGALFASTDSTIFVNTSKFYGNEAGRFGGALFVWKDSNITLDNSLLDSNRAGRTKYAFDRLLGRGSFTINHAGGAMFLYGDSNITIANSCIINNEAGTCGGGLSAHGSYGVIVYNSTFSNNSAGNDGGGIYTDVSIVAINSTFFVRNSASKSGGVIYADFRSTVIVNNTQFNNNTAGATGGVVHADLGSNVTIENSTIHNNVAVHYGGFVYADTVIITIRNCSFSSNTAFIGGGVLFTVNSISIQLDNNNFTKSIAGYGGVAYVFTSENVKVNNCNFKNNQAIQEGGVIYASFKSNLTVCRSTFSDNKARNGGGVLSAFHQCSITITNYSRFLNNTASEGGVVNIENSSLSDSISQYSYNKANDNGGVIFVNQGTITIISCTLTSNQASNNGGVIYLSFSTEMTIAGNKCILERNQALNGGAIFSHMSTIFVQGYCLLEDNHALSNGGGLYLIMSIVKFNDTLFISNRAERAGGGLHAANSSIIIEGTANFTNNKAENGGGVSLESNTKLFGNSPQTDIFSFKSNCAMNHGGALFIDDETTPDLCAALVTRNKSPTTECFTAATSVSYAFSNNYASVSGSNLFGGLLDRCTVHGKLFQTNKSISGVSTFQRLSNINESNLDTVWSHPVRMCFCRDNLPDCDYHPEQIQVSRGKGFSLALIAYDQVRHTVNAIIYSSLSSSISGLDKGQAIQHISGATCTELHFNLFTPFESDYLTLTLAGPCNITGITKAVIRIDSICSCPIGFQMSENNKAVCNCICDKVLWPYDKTECNTTTHSIIRRDNFWLIYINNTNDSSGYVIYPNCPFDYCYPPEKHISINLNLPNGPDAQCASNRSGILCGYCKPGYSISLGSTHCLRCPTYWPGLLVIIIIVAIFSGIGLVVLILILNLTVAVGTLNSIIFYANIIAANRGALFPTSETNFAYVIVEWLNFDLGIDICFFNGMDTYIKTWFQLAFTGYIIFLVVLIIQLCNRFNRFGRLIGKKDPVATLATLVLLSNTKLITLLQTIISTFLPVVLKFPDGSQHLLWLPDATVTYLSGKHAVLFITAILVILVGFVYMILLFSWQWIMRCPRKRVKQIWKQKFSSFLESYHVPYTPKHRYWTGLLLCVRGIIYLTSAFNSPGDPKITLLSTNFIVSCLLFYIAVFGIRMYKLWLMNAMEIATYSNIIILAMFALYNSEAKSKLITISVGMTLVQLLVVILYHIHTYTNIKVLVRIQNSSICKKFDELLKKKLPREHICHPNHQTPADLNNNQLLEFLDVTDCSNNANTMPTHTVTVVEIAHPHITPPPLPSEKVTEEPDSEAQQQQNKQEYIQVPKAEDITAAKVSNADTKCNHGDIGSSDCSILKEVAKPKSSDITEQAKLPGIPFTPQLIQTNGDSEHTFSHHGIVEVEVYDQ